MTDISSIALQGLNDATRRVSVAASNIARAGTNAQPANNALPNVPVAPGAPISNQGGVQVPGLLQQGNDPQNDDLTGSVLDIKQAEIGYKANVAVLKADDKMQRELLQDFKV